jgi:hypothetical protein
MRFRSRHDLDSGREVPIPVDLTLHHNLQRVPPYIELRNTSWVEQHLTNIFNECISGPNPG